MLDFGIPMLIELNDLYIKLWAGHQLAEPGLAKVGGFRHHCEQGFLFTSGSSREFNFCRPYCQNFSNQTFIGFTNLFQNSLIALRILPVGLF